MDEHVLKICKIRIRNFMSFLEKDIEFSENYTEFIGFNGVGKTTILSAINWCLFGKDYYDKTHFDMYPIIDGEEHLELKPRVEIDLKFGNETYMISRSVQGANRLTQLEVDGLKLNRNQYSQFLQEKLNINDEEFKMLSNINYAINLPQNDLKNLIVNLVGDISDEEMFKNEKVKEKFKLLESNVISVGTEVLQQNIKESKSNKKKQETKLIGAIEQEESNVEKYNFDTSHIDNLQTRKDELYNVLNDYSKRVEEENQKQKDIDELKSEIENDLKMIESKIIERKQINPQGQRLANLLQNISNVEFLREQERNKIRLEMQKLQNEINGKQLTIDTLTKQKADVVNEFNSLKSVVITIDNDTCEYCGQKLPMERIEELVQKKQNMHNQKLQALKDKNDTLKSQIEAIGIEIDTIDIKYQDLEKQMLEVDKMDFKEEIENNQQAKELNEQMQELRNKHKALGDEIKELKAGVPLKQQKLSLLPKPIKVNSIDNTKLEIENIENQLSNYNVLQEHKNNLEKLVNDKAKVSEDIVKLQHMDELLKSYKSLKSNYMTRKLERYFKFIKFKTKDVTKKGDEIDCFKVTMDDKEYYSLSSGEKMRASIDLINGIQKLKNKTIPLLIDTMGELDEFPNFVNTQVICCRAVQKPKKENPNYAQIMTKFNELQIIKN